MSEFKNLGRGETASPVVLGEIAALKKYGEALRAASSKLDYNYSERAKLRRQIYIVYIYDYEVALAQDNNDKNADKAVKKIKELYDLLKLDY